MWHEQWIWAKPKPVESADELSRLLTTYWQRYCATLAGLARMLVIRVLVASWVREELTDE